MATAATATTAARSFLPTVDYCEKLAAEGCRVATRAKHPAEMTDAELEEHYWYQHMNATIAFTYPRLLLCRNADSPNSLFQLTQFEERLRDKAACRNSDMLEDDTRWVREVAVGVHGLYITNQQRETIELRLTEIQEGRIPHTVLPGNLICAECGVNSRKLTLVQHMADFPVKSRCFKYGPLCRTCWPEAPTLDSLDESSLDTMFPFSEIALRSKAARDRFLRALEYEDLSIREGNINGVDVAHIGSKPANRKRKRGFR